MFLLKAKPYIIIQQGTMRFFGGGKRIRVLLIWALSGFILFPASLLPDVSYLQEKLREEVAVTAIEVPVRVLLDNQVVKSLAKEDFEVFENGIRQEIFGFEIVSRKIARPIDAAPKPALPSLKPRLFILIFDIFNYNDSIGEAIDYFFNTVFREKDQVVVLTEGRLLNIKRGEGLENIRADLKETLKKYKIISTQHIHKAYIDLTFECDRLLMMIGDDISPNGGPNWDQHVGRFYDNYARIWKAYRDQFLMPDMNLYLGLLKWIKPIEAEKWAICFQQRDLFPELKNGGRLERKLNMIIYGQTEPGGMIMARLIESKQRLLQESFAISKSFPADRLKNLFMEAGVTFHLVLMKTMKSLLSQDLDLKEVAQDYEACFKDISRSTGGAVVFSNRALDALKDAAEKEDYHYLLAYQSQSPLEARGKNIEVKVRLKEAKVYNLKHIVKWENPAIAIIDVRINRQMLEFGLKNSMMIETGNGARGVAEIRVTLFDEQSHEAFVESKVMDLVKEEVHIAINLEKLKKGAYFLTIAVQDRITGEKDVFSRMIEL